MKTYEIFSSTQAELRDFEHELHVQKDPARLATIRREAAGWARLMLPRLEAHLAGLRDEFTAQYRQWFGLPAYDAESIVPRLVPAHSFRSQMGQFGARLMEGFEAAFNAWLAVKIWAVDAGPFTVVGITLATLAFCEGVGRLLALHLNKRTDVPEESRERTGRVFVPTLIAWLSFFFLTYVIRTASGRVGEVLGPFTSLIFAGVEITTLILIAIGFAVHELYGWSNRGTEEYSRYLDLHTRIAALVVGVSPPEPEGTLVPQHAGPSAAAVLLAATLLLAGAAQNLLHAQPTVLQTVLTGCSFVDVSESVNSAARATALDAHRQALSATILRLRLSSWCFVQFTEDAWNAPPATIARSTTDTSAACGPVALSEAARVFTPRREQEIAEAKERCRKAEQQAADEIQHSVDASIGLLLSRNQPQPSRCTSVLDSIERAARTPTLRACTIITDGLENCGRWREIAPPDHSEEIIVILVPSADNGGKRGSGGSSFAERRAQVLRAAPWITVIPWFQFSADTFNSSAPGALARK